MATRKRPGVGGTPAKDQFKRPGGAWVHAGTRKRTKFPSTKVRAERRR